MEPLLFIPIILSFFITFIELPSWIKRAKRAGLVGKNMNKYEKTEIAEAGGITVITGLLVGILFYIALKTFYFRSTGNLIEIFALISSIVIISFIGMIDDILGWKIGLGKRIRLLLLFIAAVPLMVINAGSAEVAIPLINGIGLGLFYPLIIIPLGIMGASATFNFLAGYNGLEAGQGILVIGALSTVAFFTGSTWITLIGLCAMASLFAFLLFNKYPAKVLPGDVLTYSIGALIAIFAILGNFEKIAIFFFIPYLLETFLKLRGRLKKQSFGSPQKDGSLDMPYKKIYGLEHVAIWFLKRFKKDKKAYEKEVVYVLWLFQIIIIILGFVIFRRAIF
jgi:UDP-N-acetylglucosamine--dolichyl-phosphate N-acetylglucosaminephosphotransferase